MINKSVTFVSFHGHSQLKKDNFGYSATSLTSTAIFLYFPQIFHRMFVCYIYMYILSDQGICQLGVACVAGVKRGSGDLGARGRKERNACKELTIVFSIFHAQILSMKIVIGQN